MAISFRCQSCSKPYRVADHLAGTVVICTSCKGPMSVPTEIEAEPAVVEVPPAQRTTHMPPPTRRTPTALHAPPVAPRLPEVEPSVEDSFAGILSDLSPPAMARSSPTPPPAPALPATPTPPPTRYVPPVQPVKRQKSEQPWLLLSDEAASTLSMLLILLLLGGVVYFNHRINSATSELLPDEFAGRVKLFVGLYSAFSAVLFFAVGAPTVLLAASLAANWMKSGLPSGAYLRSAGTAAVPYLLTMSVIALAMNQHRWAVLGIVIVAPILCLLAVKELIGMKWSAALIAFGLIIPLGLGIGLITTLITSPVVYMLQKATKTDRESVAQWARANPKEYWEFQDRLAKKAQEEKGTGPPLPPPPPKPAVPDPYAGKIEPLRDAIRAAVRQAPEQTREHIRATHAQLATEFKPFAPSHDSPLWAEANAQLATLAKLASDAPSEEPPAHIYTAAADEPLPVAKITPIEWSKDVFTFKTLRIRPMTTSKIDLKGYAQRETMQRWILGDHATVEVTVLPVANQQQLRPWVSNRKIIGQLAARKNLLAITVEGEPDVAYGRSNEIGWTRIATRRGTSAITGLRYVGRANDGWIIVDPTTSWLNRAETIDLIDKFVQGISRANMFDQEVVDPFDPKLVAERFGEAWTDPTPVLKAQGEAGVAAVRDLITRLGDNAPAGAQRFLKTEADPKLVASTAGPLNVKTALTKLRSASFSSDKQTILKELAAATPDDAIRDEVAAELEKVLINDSFVESDCAAALAKWWRPQTVTALLPLLNEGGWPAKREAAMTVLAATRDRRAVYPIVRWIIQEPEKVVPVLSAMGPVAEDEVILLLREKNPAVRASAAQVLDQIGTQKCLIELRRAASDSRDPTAAAVAKGAVESVMKRVKAARAASTTGPATTQAAGR